MWRESKSERLFERRVRRGVNRVDEKEWRALTSTCLWRLGIFFLSLAAEWQYTAVTASTSLKTQKAKMPGPGQPPLRTVKFFLHSCFWWRNTLLRNSQTSGKESKLSKHSQESTKSYLKSGQKESFRGWFCEFNRPFAVDIHHQLLANHSDRGSKVLNGKPYDRKIWMRSIWHRLTFLTGTAVIIYPR